MLILLNTAPSKTILKADQLSLFDMPVHVAESVDKNGTKRPAHMSRRKKKIEKGPEASTDVPLSRLDAFIERHGGKDHFASELEAMTPEQRAKLIEAMAELGGCTHDEIIQKLEKTETVTPQQPEEVAPVVDENIWAYFEQVRAEKSAVIKKLDEALVAGVITPEQHTAAVSGACKNGAAGAVEALREAPEPPVPVIDITKIEIELIEDRQDLAEEMIKNPHSPQAKELMRKIAAQQEFLDTH